tara:strand:- start:76 stop:387 length:312 start_codon:yes stop_codon:yes gene_type:complete
MKEIISITVNTLNWGGPGICDTKSDGLWDNNHVLAIHWPIFSKHFLDDEKFSRKYIDKFYYSYSVNDYIKPINFDYFGINDIVTTNRVWDNGNKITIYYKGDD